MLVCVLCVARAHLQTPVTLCREQSIRGYVSKESMFAGAGGVCRARAHQTHKHERLRVINLMLT